MITAMVLFFLVSITALDIAQRRDRALRFAAWEVRRADIPVVDLDGRLVDRR